MGSRFRSGRPGSPHHAARLSRSVVLGLPRGTVVLGALALASPGLARTTHRAPASQAQARLTMASPVPKIYPLGSRLLFKFACTARSGVSSYRATLGGPGTRRRSVVPGSRFVPAKTGSYTLHITARDGHGKLTTTTPHFLVERAITWSSYSRAIDLRAFTL